ncbi:MAG: type II toxin-antitoxin system RelE/ParE family toxin [Myxococcota bacterium]
MSKVVLSQLAEGDLLDIAVYTLREWGDAQCTRYLGQLENACHLLADDPQRGRPCDDVRPGLFRYETGRHVVFFRRFPDGVRVLRFLHDRMLPEIHDLEGDEDQE